MSKIVAFVLDTSLGLPAAEVDVLLEVYRAGAWEVLAAGSTDAGGTVEKLLVDTGPIPHGDYCLTYDPRRYFARRKVKAFFSRVRIEFAVAANERFVLPLLLSPYGYSTYRGS